MIKHILKGLTGNREPPMHAGPSAFPQFVRLTLRQYSFDFSMILDKNKLGHGRDLEGKK